LEKNTKGIYNLLKEQFLNIFHTIKIKPSKHKDLIWNRNILWGALFPISIEDYEYLLDKQYPSLYKSSDDTQYIMGGPLSLINHDCGSYFAISNTKFEIQQEHFEELKAVGAKIICEHHLTIVAEEEITIDYFSQSKEQVDFFGKACKCKHCSNI
jgi:hypothetical protein